MNGVLVDRELLGDALRLTEAFVSLRHVQASVQRNPDVKAELLREVARANELENQLRTALALPAQAAADAAGVQELARIAEQWRERYEIAEAAQGSAVLIARTAASALKAGNACNAIVLDPRWDGPEADREAVRAEQCALHNRFDLWNANLRKLVSESGIPAWDEPRALADALEVQG